MSDSASFDQRTMQTRRFQIAVAVTATALGLLTACLVGDILTPRGFGLASLAAMVLCTFMWYHTLKGSRRNIKDLERQNAKSDRGSIYVRLTLFLFLMIYGAWATRGGPWLPRMIGATMLSLFYVGVISSRR